MWDCRVQGQAEKVLSLSLSPSSLSILLLGVNLGQTLRDGQPAIITTQRHTKSRQRAWKC